ncbi:hypothetical protein BmR1_04g07666 [Babesia microti strain RI]|uniref:Uncharacterized protein n=1 Tax=Babesia microti (strain RI) TaxID=1133968 RepID=A0A1N6LY06_BABMR|nr:hypothetical protein BmR1_04g07666 [Babesia microti strain RI]SIO73758.1 hypothetical protein BmR1_04g07666 [Babesia microti strain RI]|eukprot:XP_021337821.1 hypothetical protein BmR1_04g07666 [Babesia microti strain RI]
MTKEQAINQLILKSGYRGADDAIEDMEVQRYQSAKFKLSYEDFAKL